jgi:hypothetical protein
MMGGGRRRSSSGRERGADLRYNKSRWKKPSRAKQRRSRAVIDLMRGMFRLRREAGHTAGDLPALRRSRQGAPGAGFLFHRAHLSAVPGRGQMMKDPCPSPARGARPGTLAFGEHPGRHRRRHTHPACQRRRGGHARRAER